MSETNENSPAAAGVSAAVPPAAVARPGGVTAVVIILWLVVAFTLFEACMIFATGLSQSFKSQVSSNAVAEGYGLNEALQSANAASVTLVILSILVLLLAILMIATATGIAMGHNGWRIFLTVVVAIRIVGEIVAVVYYAKLALPFYTFAAIVSVVISVLILVLLFNSKSNAYFSRKPALS